MVVDSSVLIAAFTEFGESTVRRLLEEKTAGNRTFRLPAYVITPPMVGVTQFLSRSQVNETGNYHVTKVSANLIENLIVAKDVKLS